MRLGIAAVLAVVLAVPLPARADGIYFSEGGGGVKIENDLGRVSDGGLHLRVAVGYRAKQLALEAWVSQDLVDEPGNELMRYGLDAKRPFKLGGPFEIYLRGSISRMKSELPRGDYAGRGLGFGTGIQVKGKAPLLALLIPAIALVCLNPKACKMMGPRATFAAFLDQGYDFYRLRGPGPSIDAEVTRWTLGFAVGSDF